MESIVLVHGSWHSYLPGTGNDREKGEDDQKND